MNKLRKMLGDVNSEEVIALMKLMEMQNATVLANWALHYVSENVLPIYEKRTQDNRVKEVVLSTMDYLNGMISQKEMKQILKEAKTICDEFVDMPIELASVRAIITACGVKHTPTNALGFTFYSCAAVVYDTYGLEETKENYNMYAQKEFANVLKTLKDVAVENEEHPIKVKWHC